MRGNILLAILGAVGAATLFALLKPSAVARFTVGTVADPKNKSVLLPVVSIPADSRGFINA